MARARQGTLIWSPAKNTWVLRIPVIVARLDDGTPVREKKWIELDTASHTVAQAKRRRIVADLERDERLPDRVHRETVSQACERVHEQRLADGVKAAKDEIGRLRAYALPAIGHVAVQDVIAADVNSALDACKAAGKSRQTCAHLLQDLKNVFTALAREGALRSNPADDARLPRFAATVRKERAVLTDAELAVYLAYVHPQEHWRLAILERQTMACLARMFGGLRTGDLHALRWEAFDVEHGGFAWGWAPRQKTKRPQLLEVPEMLREILRDWWERHGRPREGLIFPARRGKRAGEAKIKVSHARAFRRDLRRAFGIEQWNAERQKYLRARAPTARERELLEVGAYTLPVDFHSWRRAFSQALEAADVNVQKASKLAGHASLSAHARYLANSGKLLRIPEAALPDIRIGHSDRTQHRGSREIAADRDRLRATEIDMNVASLCLVAQTVTPEAAGSSPVRPAHCSLKLTSRT